MTNKNSPLDVKHRADIIGTCILHGQKLHWQSPVAHLYPSLGGLHVNVQFTP